MTDLVAFLHEMISDSPPLPPCNEHPPELVPGYMFCNACCEKCGGHGSVFEYVWKDDIPVAGDEVACSCWRGKIWTKQHDQMRPVPLLGDPS